jgi:hypothetical protein
MQGGSPEIRENKNINWGRRKEDGGGCGVIALVDREE